jgi:hypothetical protein
LCSKTNKQTIAPNENEIKKQRKGEKRKADELNDTERKHWRGCSTNKGYRRANKTTPLFLLPTRKKRR